MNGPVKFYITRQIIRHDLEVTLPNCMYKMKNIHSNKNDVGPLGDHVSPFKDSVDISMQTLQHPAEMSPLINRQEKILQDLHELREQMIKLKSDLSECIPKIKPAVSKEIPELAKIVINASPTHPPYSLLLIQKLCSNFFNLSVTTHLHSTVQILPENAVTFVGAVETFILQPNLPSLAVRLIWKDVGPTPQLIVSQLPIIGESNLLRYLARTTPDILKYETAANLSDIDSVLDISYCLVRAKTKTERSGLIQSLNKKLGKGTFLCGHSEITIADIAATSAIKQVAANEINQTMSKWLQRCEA